MKITDDMLKQAETALWYLKACGGFDGEFETLHTILQQAARRTTPDREAWISVDERLPEEGQDVAFVVKAAKGSIQDYLNGRVLGGRFMIVSGHPTFTVPGVGFNASHWMPLPTAPTSDKGGA